jgi:hypothetical protein
MKNKITKALFLLFSLLLTNTTKAQYETKYTDCGVLIDGVLADKIDCWSFKEMFFVFPVKNIKKCDRYTIEYYGYLSTMRQRVLSISSREQFNDFYADGDLGIVIVTNPHTDKTYDGYQFRDTYSSVPADHTISEKDLKENNKMVITFYGEMIVGSVETKNSQGQWEKTPKYGEKTMIYSKVISLPPMCIKTKKSRKNPGNDCVIDYNISCTITGKKFEHTVEIDPNYSCGLVKLKK